MSLSQIKILHVDDEQEIRVLMKSILKDDVQEFYSAKNNTEALEIYRDKKPDIILLDINMQDCDGLELAKTIREKDHSTRIIMITAHSDIQRLLLATELKLTKYLIKPFQSEDLFGAIYLALQELQNFSISSKKILQLKDKYVWDYTEKILFKDSCEINLTPKERKILDILFSNINKTISYDTLFIEAWDSFDSYNIDTLKTTMKNIRKKLPAYTIQNIYATGFKVIL